MPSLLNIGRLDIFFDVVINFIENDKDKKHDDIPLKKLLIHLLIT